MHPQYISNTVIRQIFLILLIAGLCAVLFWQLQFFLPALLGAYALYILLRGPLFYLTERWKWPRKLATAVLVLLLIGVITLPIQWLFNMLNARLLPLMQNRQETMASVGAAVHSLETRLQMIILTDENLQKLSDWGLQQGQYLFSATLHGLEILLATLVLLWFMLVGGKKMEDAFFDELPLKRENQPYLKRELHNLVYANAIGIPLMGIIQGLVALLAYWIAGVDDLWLWFGLTLTAGMLPIFGVALAYVPLSLILLSQGEEVKALLIFLYGFVVVGSVDNLARMWLLQRIGHTHPLVTLFGVIVGLKMFGLIGFIFGPIMIALVVLLFNVYHKEFITKL